MSDTSEDKNDQPLRSVHTSNVPAILEQLGASLLVSTYQAGRLVLFRPDNGVLNTHFRLFDKPMGLALSGERLAIGTAMQICEFHNIPSVADRILAKEKESQSEASTHPPRRNDSVFIPRIAHWTGDIQVHEMVWNERELWYVNTLFSCICKRSDTFNFEPVWRPPFIDKYIPGDCCHLNGLGLRDGKPRYATALGKTNEPEGWRQNKKDGGILIDCQSNEIITEGLSMPHSPRWYRDRLWVLQSGTGSIGYIDSATGRYESVAEMPGFTRGLSFAGPLAFIGLSQVRESAVFGGIPIAERSLEERACGVWIVNIETGETIGFVKFEDAVQEIFAVELLPNSTYPEIVNEDREILSSSYELPDAVLDEVPESLKS